jgi:membrane dipeptidase
MPELVFDGHNDVLSRVRERPGDGRWFLRRGRKGHLDLERARAGGFGGGLFAVFVQGARRSLDELVVETEDGYEIPPLPAIDAGHAWEETIAMVAALHRLARASGGALEVVRDAEALEAALAEWRIAAVLHVEGAEPLDGPRGFEDRLEALHAAGLRSLGVVWSRPSAFGHGVPFRFPSTPDTGPGLTAAGRRLVRACNRLGVLVDLAHLNARGFRDVARISDAPLVASHTAAHAITPSSRNLTDAQLDAIGASGGLVGINFNVSDVRPDGCNDPDTPLDAIAAHAEHVAERIGIDHVGLGSDFDGATMPRALRDAAGLPRLIEALRARGFDAAAVRKVARENWVRVLRETWARGAVAPGG